MGQNQQHVVTPMLPLKSLRGPRLAFKGTMAAIIVRSKTILGATGCQLYTNLDQPSEINHGRSLQKSPLITSLCSMAILAFMRRFRSLSLWVLDISVS